MDEPEETREHEVQGGGEEVRAPGSEGPEGEGGEETLAPGPEVPEGEGGEDARAPGPEGPVATSVFVADPEGGAESFLEDSFWSALPVFREFKTLGGSSPVKPKTRFSAAHDARHLALRVTCEEPEMDRVWTRRTAAVGHLDLDDSVEILLDPYHAHGFHWSLVVTPAGEWEIVPPVGAVGVPECLVEVRTSGRGWEALVRVPFVDVGLEGDLRGSPVDGDVWGLAVVRRRRESRSLKREIAAWASDVTAVPAGPGEGGLLLREASVPSVSFGHVRFQGGRPRRPVEFTRYAAGGYGVNEICVAFSHQGGGEGAGIPPGLEVEVRPGPAKRLRSKDLSRCKFRVARPGLYRYRLRIPYVPPPEPTEEEAAELEAEIGRELEAELGRDATEEELTQKLAERLSLRPGTPEFVAGLSFLLPDIWTEIEKMEGLAEAARAGLEEEGLAVDARMAALFNKFDNVLNSVDRYRAPHSKDLLGPELVEKLRAAFDDLRASVRKALLRAGKLSIASPYLAGGSWHLGALRVRTKHSCGSGSAEEAARKLLAAGYSFCAFADLAEGGDQDGDGEHDWNGDGTVSPAARRIKATGRAVAEDRGREPFVVDYSRTAAEQGKPWVDENWKLSEPGSFVVLRAVEAGPHHPAVCIGVPAGGLPAGSSGSYEAVGTAQRAGGVAVLCEAPGDLRELPPELEDVVGIDVPPDAWDRLLAAGRKVLLFPGALVDAVDLAKHGPPEHLRRVGVLADSLTEESVVSALRRGSFYVTSGPEITGIEVRGDRLKVRTTEQCQILFRGQGGQMLGGSFGTEAEYRFTGREKYVRVVCLADVLEDGSRIEALTQPFYFADGLPVSPVGDTDWTIAEPVDSSAEPEEPEETGETEEPEETEKPEETEEAEETEETEETEADEAGIESAEAPPDEADEGVPDEGASDEGASDEEASGEAPGQA